MNMPGITAAHQAQPGDLFRSAAYRLTTAGLEASTMPGEASRLLIGCPHTRRLLSVSDCGLAGWQCCPRPGPRPDLAEAADLAAAMLTGRTADFPRVKGTARPPILVETPTGPAAGAGEGYREAP